MTKHWPGRVLSPTDISFDLQPNPIGGSPSMDGYSQDIQSDAGFWVATYTNVNVGNPQKIKAFRAIAAYCSGPVNPLLVPVMDWLRAPWPLDGFGNPIMSNIRVGFSDSSNFSDGTQFISSVIDIRTYYNSSAGDTEIMLRLYNGAAPEAGQFFSIGERLAQIVSVDSVSGNICSVTITPRLREDVPGGSGCDFDNPKCRMRLASGAEMKLPLNAGLIGAQTVNFIEDL